MNSLGHAGSRMGRRCRLGATSAAVFLTVSLVAGCAGPRILPPVEPLQEACYYMPEKQTPLFLLQAGGTPRSRDQFGVTQVIQPARAACACRGTPHDAFPLTIIANHDADHDVALSGAGLPVGAPALSPGDRLRVLVREGEDFSGLYEIDMDGSLRLPYLPGIQVVGIGVDEVESRIENALVQHDLFRPQFVEVSLAVKQWAPIEIHVSGAVFRPGRVMINERQPKLLEHKRDQQNGDYASKRFLSAAVKGAGGARPDAALDQVTLVRNGRKQQFDLTGVLSGAPYTDLPLIAGDQVFVPTSGCFREDLMRPSYLTPPGFDIFISTLTRPAPSNNQAAVRHTMPYGTRLLRALMAANCVGGTQTTNMSRRAVLVSTNPLTGKTEVIERRVQDLVAHHQRDEFNPYLLPNDGVACYDSTITNMRDASRTLIELLAPLAIVL